MRCTYWIAATLTLLSLTACGDSDELTPVTPKGGGSADTSSAKGALGIEAAMIRYKQTGMPSGQVTVWFQDHGATVVWLEVMQRSKMKTHQKTIWRNGMTTMYDYEANKEHTNKRRVKVTELAWNAHLKEAALASVGVKKVGTETLHGLECTIWDNTSLKIKTWVHGHLVIKEENDLGGYVREAVEFKRIDTIPDDAFAIPGS